MEQCTKFWLAVGWNEGVWWKEAPISEVRFAAARTQEQYFLDAGSALSGVFPGLHKKHLFLIYLDEADFDRDFDLL